MNVLQTSISFLPLTGSAGGNVYVPPTVCLRSAYPDAHAAAYVDRTGSAWTTPFADLRPASSLAPNSLIWEVS